MVLGGLEFMRGFVLEADLKRELSDVLGVLLRCC